MPIPEGEQMPRVPLLLGPLRVVLPPPLPPFSPPRNQKLCVSVCLKALQEHRVRLHDVQVVGGVTAGVAAVHRPDPAVALGPSMNAISHTDLSMEMGVNCLQMK